MMSIQEVNFELDRFHALVCEGKTDDEVIALYKRLVNEEICQLQEAKTVPSIVKEACDVIVVCRPLINFADTHTRRMHYEIAEAAKRMIHGHGLNWWPVLGRVNESNMSKFVPSYELDEAHEHFLRLGIDVKISTADSEIWKVCSARDQRVDGKEYPAGKLLKSHRYFAIDESVEWWL